MKLQTLPLVGLTTGLAAAAAAQDSPNYNSPLAVSLDGSTVVFPDTQPTMIEGRPMVPLRAVIEAAGGTVYWDGTSQSVHAQKDGVLMDLVIGSAVAQINARDETLEASPILLGDRTMVPLSFFNEAFSASTYFQPEANLLSISTVVAQQSPDSYTYEEHGPYVPASPTITSFNIESSPWVAIGNPVTIVADGTPGLEATCQISGYGEEIKMVEETPGHYVATWTPPGEREVYQPQAIVTCTLRDGASSDAPAVEAIQTLSIDTSMPAISNFFPNEEGRVARSNLIVSAELNDSGSGIDAASVQLLVNGVDRTSETSFSEDRLTWTPAPDEIADEMNVEITAKDMAGNTSTRSWTFRTEPEGMEY